MAFYRLPSASITVIGRFGSVLSAIWAQQTPSASLIALHAVKYTRGSAAFLTGLLAYSSHVLRIKALHKD
ncbi:MAG: hypothetical protein ACK41E_12135 [Deinococcales bacterium]